MSSGVEADIALDAAVVASLGLIRVMGGTAGLAATATAALAALTEGRAEVRARRIRETERLDETVGDVLDRNARIAALAESARRHGVAVDLPAPLDLTGRSVDDLTEWAARVDADLVIVEEALAASIAAAVMGRVFSAVPESLKSGSPDGRPDDVSRPTVEEDLSRVLARLLPDAADADRRSVARAAEQVMTAPSPAESESHLTDVRIRIQRANERARARRDDRAVAARFRRELAAHPSAGALLPLLAEVAEGSRTFDGDLRAKAARLVGEAQERAERHYLSAVLREAFGELGYGVAEGFETLTTQDGEAVLTRGDWPQHAVKVRIDQARSVRMALLRTEPAASDDHRRLDVEREEQWCASFEAARQRLADAGIQADIRWRIEPGDQRLPVARRPRSQRRQHERHRELGGQD